MYILENPEEIILADLPPGVFWATFSNGQILRSDTEFICDSWNQNGHTAIAGELVAKCFEYQSLAMRLSILQQMIECEK